MTMKNKVLIPFFQKLPCAFRGKGRLARVLLKRVVAPCEIPTQFGKMTVPNLVEPVGWDLAVNGCYEPDLCQFIEQQVKAGQTCLDIGANIGAISLALAKQVGHQGRVYAFEPSPRIFPYLKKNTLKHPQIKSLETALSSEKGETVFYQAPEHKFGMGTLSALEGWVPTKVKTDTLDEFCQTAGIGRVDFIKIDVEGHEADAFRGGRETLSKNHQIIIVFEFSDWAENNAFGKSGESPRLLAEMGFQLAALEKGGKIRPLGDNLPKIGTWNLVACRDLSRRFLRP